MGEEEIRDFSNEEKQRRKNREDQTHQVAGKDSSWKRERERKRGGKGEEREKRVDCQTKVDWNLAFLSFEIFTHPERLKENDERKSRWEREKGIRRR